MSQVGLSPYIPRKYMESTEFPEAWGRDVQLQIRMIRERYMRFYPAIGYYQLIQGTGIASTPDVVTGAPAPVADQSVPTAAAFDTLYGESMDRQAADANQWDQPHLSGTQDATTEVEGFRTPVPIHMRVERPGSPNDRKRLLNLYGFDKIRDIVVHVPAFFFDECGFRAKEGDKIVWDGQEYVVLQEAGAGWWKNSNVRLYRGLSMEHKRLGS